jgi:hypothetical protein
VYNNPCCVVFPTFSLSSTPVTYFDGSKVTKRPTPSKSVGVDDIPRFLMKRCTDKFVPVLQHIFNLSLSQQYFRTLWKQAATVPVLKKECNSASVSIYRPMFLLNKSSELL